MEKNLITEIHRISELIGVESKITLNENTIGQLFGQALEAEIKKLLKTEVKNAVKASVRAGATDADSIVKSLGKNTKAIADAQANVMVKAGKKSLSNAEKTAIKIEMVRVAKEEAEAATKKGLKQGVETSAEKASREAAERAAKEGGERAVNVTVINTVEQNAENITKIKGGVSKKTAGGGTKRITATADDLAEAEGKGLTKIVQIGGVDYVMELAKKGFSFRRMIKSAAFKWGLGLLAAGLIVWWILATMADTVPEDTTPEPPKPEDTDNDGDGGIYTTPGDPYQYKVVDCVWFTKSLEQRGKIISDWTSLANNQKAIGILDGRFPDARKNCGGNTPTPTPTTNNDTLTPSGTTLNQQYGTEPMGNAQPEVQTTNDDINNY